MSNIVFVSDFTFSGSGYLNISIPLCERLAANGHSIKAVGLGYMGMEHNFDFTIIPCATINDALAMVNNLKHQWTPDILIVALDIPLQHKFSLLAKKLGVKMIAITPLENSPLTFTWAQYLTPIEKVFFISELGHKEAELAGMTNSEHLQVGIDTASWRPKTSEEYQKGREMLNISPDTLVVMTVAANQERKNFSKAFEIMSLVKHKYKKKIKYILVTQENSDVGWKLRDLGMTYNIASDVMIFERGIPFAELFAFYAISDAFLLTSKAEGLCMPVIEAMSIGTPVVATNCGAIPELLSDGRGFMIETEYSMIDPWGNSRRDFPSAESGAKILAESDLQSVVYPAQEYVKKLDWNIASKQVEDAIYKILEVPDVSE